MGAKLLTAGAIAVAILVAAGLLGLGTSSGSESKAERQSVHDLAASIRAAERARFEARGEYTESLADLATHPGGGSILGAYGVPHTDVEIETGNDGRSVLVKVSRGEAVGWFVLLGGHEYGSGGYANPASGTG
jgi:hypothetical protein